MSDPVWHRIDRELSNRKAAHLLPGTWAALGRILEVSAQVLTNWKARGVPPKEHQAIADALGWTVDQLLGVGELPVKTPITEPMISLMVTPEEMAWVLAHRNAIGRRNQHIRKKPARKRLPTPSTGGSVRPTSKKQPKKGKA
jgi:hypothetical protein